MSEKNRKQHAGKFERTLLNNQIIPDDPEQWTKEDIELLNSAYAIDALISDVKEDSRRAARRFICYADNGIEINSAPPTASSLMYDITTKAAKLTVVKDGFFTMLKLLKGSDVPEIFRKLLQRFGEPPDEVA